MKPRKLPENIPSFAYSLERNRSSTRGKQTITVRLAKGTKERIAKRCIDLGMGMKGKSAWVNEALKSYLADKHWLAMTTTIARFEPAVTSKTGESDQLTLDLDVWVRAWEAATNLTRWFYEHEGEALQPDLSMICRSAIAHAMSMQLQDNDAGCSDSEHLTSGVRSPNSKQLVL